MELVVEVLRLVSVAAEPRAAAAAPAPSLRERSLGAPAMSAVGAVAAASVRVAG